MNGLLHCIEINENQWLAGKKEDKQKFGINGNMHVASAHVHALLCCLMVGISYSSFFRGLDSECLLFSQRMSQQH